MEATRVLIDTSVIIKFIRSKNKQKTLLWQLMKKYKCYVSVITVFELYNGAKTQEHYNILETIFNRIKTIDFNQECAIRSADIYKFLRKENKLIEFRDIFIAATSLVHEMPLSTYNLKHFERVEKIELVKL